MSGDGAPGDAAEEAPAETAAAGGDTATGTTDGGDTREAFSLLGHELRLETLLALLEGWRAARTEPRRYSDLMRAVGLQDSGKFNYHLGRLRGVYVRKQEGGYVPTAAATALYRAVLAHRPTAAAGRTRLDPEVTCPDCDSALAAEHEAGFLSVRCEVCADPPVDFSFPFPVNGLEGRSDTAVVRAAFERARAAIGLARRGQCPDCAGRPSRSVRPSGDGPPVRIDCDTCTWVVETGYLLPLQSAPRVAGALSTVGLPADGFPWELPTPVVAVRQEPWRASLTVDGPDGTATVTVDADLAVRSVGTAEE
jgi:hypothetical protein